MNFLKLMFSYKKKIAFNKIPEEINNISEKIRILKLPNGFLEGILYTISELFLNIEEHSNAKEAKIGIKIDNKNCFIKISDNGIGFRKSYLLKNIYPKDDFSAIEFALSGLSTKDPQERGFGLYTIKKFVESLKGRMIIETGRAKAIIEKEKISFQNLKKETRGVSINIIAKVKKINFYEIIK